MKEELLNDIPYGVIVCQDNGDIVYLNTQAASYLDFKENRKNFLTYLDDDNSELIKSILDEHQPDYKAYIRIKGNINKTYKVTTKRSTKNPEHVIFMIYDNSDSAIIFENNKILKTISNICKDLFCKDRSNLDDIVVDLTQSFHLKLGSIYFKNGTNHLVYCIKNNDGSFTHESLDGCYTLLSNQDIWVREKNYKFSDELIFHVNLKDIDNPILSRFKKERPDDKISILKLKLTNNNVVGFFEFIEDDNFKLSVAEIEILESLSQILAYIINNKEQIDDISSYIKEKFDSISKG